MPGARADKVWILRRALVPREGTEELFKPLFLLN